MIRNILFISFLFIANLSIGQVSIEADLNPAGASGLATAFEIVAKLKLTNTSSEAKTFTWQRDESNFVNGWESGACDKNLCYSRSTDTQTFELAAGEVGLMDLHLYPEGFCGDGYGEITITDNNDAANSIILRYNFVANQQTGVVCATSTSVVDYKLGYVKVYPNPANDFFTLTDVPSGLETVSIFNILGREVKTFTAAKGANYNISDLASGLYLINLTNAARENLNTIKIRKN